MKYWLSHLPCEVWVDVFRYNMISRERLGRMADRIGNRKYAEYLQFYLHDWGKHKLSNLWFDQNGLYKHVDYDPYRLYMDIPMEPLPESITSFKRIQISHFNTQTIAFLRQIGPILTNVNISFYVNSPSNLDILRTILTNFRPLLNSIHSMNFDVFALSTVQQSIGDHFDQTKVLTVNDCGIWAMDEAAVRAAVGILLNWLTLPSGPKFCRAYLPYAPFGKSLPAFRQEFLSAQTPRTFALILINLDEDVIVDPIYDFVFENWGDFDEFHLTNSIGEELHGQLVDCDYQTEIRITRHQANCAMEMREWIEKENHLWVTDYRSQNHIDIDKSTTIGLDGLDVRENVEEAQQQPSTSKED